MAFVRVKKRENPYVQIDKRIFEDESLSWAAKGLMSYLLSRPDNWKINQTDLAKRSKCGETIVRSALLNLMENGYVYYYAEREKGKIIEWIYQVYESPEENPYREEAQKKAKEKIAERKKKQKAKSSKKAVKSTFSPERENHVVEENDLNSPEREILDVVNLEQETLAYNNNNLNKNDLNKNKDNIYLSKKEEIKNTSIPDQLKSILEKQIDKLIDFNINIQEIELHFKATEDVYTFNEYSHVLSALLIKLVKKPDNFINVLNNWLNRNREKLNEVAAKKVNTPTKPTRTEIVPEWIKNEQKQEEQSPDFLERKVKLQARLKEKYKKKNAQ